MLRRLASHAGEPVVGAAPSSVRTTLRNTGRPLDPATRASMEASLGGDFSMVRIHDDAAASASARDVSARAYTVGRHVVFATGEFRPSDPAGQRLLAHELRHVMQDGAAARDVDGPIAIGAPDSAAERDAESVSRSRVVSSRSATVVRRQVAPDANKTPYPGAPTVDGKQDVGTQLSYELADSPDAATPAERAFKWLQLHATEIGSLEEQYGVDRRAIAGVVAWEALRNPRGRVAGTVGRFAGAGKPHTRQDVAGAPGSGETVAEEVEQAGYLPRRSWSERSAVLEKDSLPYIAAGMRLAVDIARSYGVELAANPGMLAWFWVSKDATTFITYLSKKTDQNFDVGAEAMPKWVIENQSWLESAVGKSKLARPGAGQAKLGTLETASWNGTYAFNARLPETREFLVNTGAVSLTISADTDYVKAFGYPVYVVLHRRAGNGVDQEVGESMKFELGGEATFGWSNLVDGLYYFEIFSFNGVPVTGELHVSLGQRAPIPKQAAAPQILRRATDAGTEAPVVAIDEGKLRAEAARKLVRDLEAKKAVYGHELQGDVRKPTWWWGETEFDCSKFVLWVLAGRQVGDAPAPTDQRLDKAIRNVSAPPFGRVSDASAVSAMIKIVDDLVAQGKAGAIDKDRAPQIGDLMFWGGHVAIVVDVQPASDGDVWVVYANMGTSGAAITGVDAKGHMWLKASEVAARKNLGVGAFKGYWTP